MRKVILSISLLLCMSFGSYAQDMHFSQFFASPLMTNPALTGHFDATYRFSGILRQQWSSVSNQPYESLGGGIDINGPFGAKPIGLGVQLAQDRAGLSVLTTSHVNLMASTRFRFGASKDFTVRLGVMGGMFRQSIDFSKLTWDDQFQNGRFDPNIITLQPLAGTSIQVLNFGLGIYGEKKYSARTIIGLGYSMFNALEPSKAFIASYELPLERRHSVHSFTSFQLTSSLDIMPAAIFQMQGKTTELIGGTNLRYHLVNSPTKNYALYLGGWYRLNDAINGTVGMDINHLFVGLAYDVNVSDFTPATDNRGAWEVSVIYTIATIREKAKRLRRCPDYL